VASAEFAAAVLCDRWRPAALPLGLQLAGCTGADEELLGWASAVEAALAEIN
jgi:Asp-tRNA(Asn)/Glu-tRNA(Gln) amidotransferase A subunit family amidase